MIRTLAAERRVWSGTTRLSEPVITTVFAALHMQLAGYNIRQGVILNARGLTDRLPGDPAEKVTE